MAPSNKARAGIPGRRHAARRHRDPLRPRPRRHMVAFDVGGSSATTAPMCVDVEQPTLLLVARNRGSRCPRCSSRCYSRMSPVTSRRCRSETTLENPPGNALRRQRLSRTASSCCRTRALTSRPPHAPRRARSVDRRRLRRSVPTRLDGAGDDRCAVPETAEKSERLVH
jgi:hypothetical protein